MKNKNLISLILSVILSFVFVAIAVYAATTIGTNINTGGTLTVTGQTTLGNASTTLMTVTDKSYLGTVAAGTWNGTAIGVTYGGTGLTTAPSYGQLLVGNASGGYTLTATSSLGIALSDTTGTLPVNRGGTGLTSYIINQLLYASGASTIGQIATSSLGLLTTNVAEGTNLYWTNTRFDNRLSATTTLPNLTTLTGLTNASTTLLSIGSSGATISKHLSATASLTFGAIGANSCGTQTMTVTGAADGDTVVLGIPNALASASTTIVFTGWVSAANTVSVRLCQTAATAGTFSAATARADVWEH